MISKQFSLSHNKKTTTIELTPPAHLHQRATLRAKQMQL